MPSQGPRNPTASADETSVGTVAWSGHEFTRVASNDDLYGTAADIDNATTPVQNSIKLYYGGAVVGNEKSTGADCETGAGYDSFGGSADLWGLTPTVSDVNGADFGVCLSYTGNLATTYYLRASGFGFTVPAGSTIDGILVEVNSTAHTEFGNQFVDVDHVRITVTYSTASAKGMGFNKGATLAGLCLGGRTLS